MLGLKLNYVTCSKMVLSRLACSWGLFLWHKGTTLPCTKLICYTYRIWRYDMETFPTLLVICKESPVDFPPKWAVMRKFLLSLMLAWTNMISKYAGFLSENRHWNPLSPRRYGNQVMSHWYLDCLFHLTCLEEWSQTATFVFSTFFACRF